MLRGVVIALGLAAAGCATSHVGTWEYRGQSYLRLDLEPDGSCTLAADTHVAGIRGGIGARCRYSRSGDVVSITELANVGDTGPFERLARPMHLRVEPDKDKLVQLDGGFKTLTRISKW